MVSYSLVAKAAVDGPHEDIPGAVKATDAQDRPGAVPKERVAKLSQYVRKASTLPRFGGQKTGDYYATKLLINQ